MKYLYIFIFALSLFDVTLSDAGTTGSSLSETRPVYSSEELPPNSKYVPHKTYFDSGVQQDVYPSYGDYYPYPLATPKMPTTQGLIQTGLNLFYKFGFFVVGGAALLFVGGLFMTAICSLTSFCTISFTSFGNVDKDAMMRSFMTPDKLATAAAMVQDAFGKYQRLQKTKEQ